MLKTSHTDLNHNVKDILQSLFKLHWLFQKRTTCKYVGNCLITEEIAVIILGHSDLFNRFVCITGRFVLCASGTFVAKIVTIFNVNAKY